MTGFSVDFFGCKISQTDAETVREALAEAGHAELREGELAVVNTCCITAQAERKARQGVRRLLRQVGDGGRVIVTGCGANLNAEQYTKIDPRVTVLPGATASNLSVIASAADQLAELGCKGAAPGTAPDTAPGFEPALGQRRSGAKRTRAFIKVQDGCNFHCSYCIVPTVRGEPRSRPLDAVLDDVRRRVARGQHEIVLTGVNIGLYRDADSRASLPTLLGRIAQVDGVSRVRISSIEVNHVSRRLVEAMARHADIVCPHLHIPLQSGDDAVLGHMDRHYNVERYQRAIDTARSLLPQLNLTTDVIVGYPTEDDASFERTRAFCAQIGFTKIHAFPFSQRPGTEVVSQHDPISREIKSGRSRLLREDADARAVTHRRSLVGTRQELLLETRRTAGNGGGAGIVLTDAHVAADASDACVETARVAAVRTGYTRDYSPVIIDAPCALADGTIVDVDIIAIDDATGVLHGAVMSVAVAAG